MIRHLTLILSLTFLSSVLSQSKITYNIVLIFVILELVFAFSIGLICILFSYNLFKAIKESESSQDIAEYADNMSYNSIHSSIYGTHNLENGGETKGNNHNYDLTKYHDVHGDITYDRHDTGSGENDEDSEYDYEKELDDESQGEGEYGEVSIGSIIQSFTPYLKLW